MVCEFGNGFANFAKWFAKFAMWFANFAMRNFAKVLMFYVRQMNSVLALRNWPCEIGIAKLALRNWHLRNWHCEIRNAKLVANTLRIWQCEISLRFCERRISQRYSVLGLLNFAMRNWLPTHCEIRNGCELFANSLRKSCFAVFPCFSSCLQLHLILSTFPLFFH